MLQEPTPVPAPPSWAQRFRTDDLDELRAFVERTVGSHSRLVRGKGRLGFDQASLAGGAAALGWVRTALGTITRGAVRDPTLHLAVPMGSSYRIGRRRHEATPGSVTFLAPGWHYTLDRPAGLASAVTVNQQALNAELLARLPASPFDPLLRARPIALAEGQRVNLAGALDALARALGRVADPVAAAHAEARLVAALAEILTDQEVAVRGLEVAAARMASLEAWIEANLDEPITIGTLCDIAGVGERALQKRFELRRGMSPMRFVTERRLEAARRDLSRAGPGASVTRIAIRLGFDHTGRFAALYRQTFGETPSETLARARQ